MIRVPAETVGSLPTAWRHCVGTGRTELALRRDYFDSLKLVQREIGFQHIRGHGLFGDSMGVVRPYEHQGTRGLRHSFTYVDQVIDAYLELGIRPFLELGFMPEELASGSQTVFWWKGNVTPPRSHSEWADLVRATLTHLIDRYGLDEVRTWPIEVWNEPNLDLFWENADEKAYHHLYEVTAHTVKEVDASLQVGGPAISPGADEWMPRFTDFTDRHDVPLDFVSRHAYTSGPAQRVPFASYQTLAPARDLLDQFAVPRRQLKGTRYAELPVHITEFNSSYCPDNPIHDTAFNAAYLAPVLAEGGELADSFSYWTFSDMFEEAGVPTALFHGGFGLLTHRQVKKPTFHLYAFMSRMGEDLLSRGDHHLVTRHPDGRVTVLAWAPVDPTGETPGPDRHEVHLSIPLAGTGTSGPEAFVRRSTVDEDHGNAYTAWREMGSPRSPKQGQLDMLHEASEPARTHFRLPLEEGRADLRLTLARNEITLVELAPLVDETSEWWDERRLLGRETP
ncbi:GH39 family glycosyl hydrolase [Streptomyces acidiscabies]|uniref:GH39 family glycosyl hydrolase n=1 Tax=Streptomyces acidiscabies TaxID=42234 RepID=UPI00076ECDD1|nr:xylan 1,4-beta-xylosidase [Streptomyces acidiscabies]GAQ55373.1 beta-xylosidase [Streptomyces acidiscabies]